MLNWDVWVEQWLNRLNSAVEQWLNNMVFNHSMQVVEHLPITSIQPHPMVEHLKCLVER